MRPRNFCRTTAGYENLSREPWDGPCRFDVLAIDLAPEAEPRFTLLRNAFQVEE